MRYWLIMTGVPLAICSLILSVYLAGPVAILAITGTFVAIKTFELIVARSERGKL